MATPATQKSGSPPIFTLDKIQYFIFQQFRIEITLDELKNPTPTLLITLFSAFLQDFQFDLDSFRQIMFQHSMEHPEIMEHSIPTYHLFQAVKNVLDLLHFKDFAMKDITKPDRKRTRKILSYFINFWRFYVSREEMLHEVANEYKGVMCQIQEKEKDIEMVKQEINKHSIFLAENEKELTEDQDRLLVKQSQLESYKQKANELQKLKSEHKLKIAELENKITEEEVELSKQRAQLASLRGQLVQSPERLKSELASLKSRSLELERYGAGLEARKAQLNEEHQRLESFAEITASFASALDSFDGEVLKIKTAQEEKKALETKVQALMSKLADLEGQKQSIQERARLEKEAHFRLIHTLKEKIEKFQEACDQAKQEQALALEKQTSIQDEVKSRKSYIADLAKKVAEEEARTSALDNKMAESCKFIHQKLMEESKANAQEIRDLEDAIETQRDSLKKLASSLQDMD